MNVPPVFLTGLAASFLIGPATAVAQDSSNRETPVTRLTVDPAPTPRPALKYRLLPAHAERKAGNAAPFYYRALLHLTRVRAGMTREQIEFRDGAREAPVDEFPKSEVREFLKPYAGVFNEVTTAAYRDQCDWDWQVREMTGAEVISLTLDEAQEAREIARVLALRARLAIAEDRYDDAFESLRIGYQMAHDIAEQQMLISSLVGMAVIAIMDEQLETLIAAPGSPNLYWALTTLPRPFIDIRDDIEREINVIEQVFPYLTDADSAERSTEQWRQLLTRSIHMILNGNYEMATGEIDAESRWVTLAVVMQGYPEAKRALARRGYSSEEIDQMPVGQAIAIHVAQINRYVADSMTKWAYLPYHQAKDRIRLTERRLKLERVWGPVGHTMQTVPVTGHLFPAIEQVLHAGARRDLAIAAHRVIEAIRLHAYHHEAQLPKSLADVTVVPVPDNPVTGEPFPYELRDGTAVLTLPTTEKTDPRFGRIFEITIRESEN